MINLKLKGFFADKRQNNKWEIDSHESEQVKCSKYLGTVFQASRKLTAQVNYTTSIAQKNTQAVTKFYRQQATNYIPAAIKLFMAIK